MNNNSFLKTLLDLTPSDSHWNIPLHMLCSSKRNFSMHLIFKKLLENNHKEKLSYKVESRNFIPFRIVLMRPNKLSHLCS